MLSEKLMTFHLMMICVPPQFSHRTAGCNNKTLFCDECIPPQCSNNVVALSHSAGQHAK